MIKFITFVLLAASAVPAIAAPPATVSSVVKTADLDLTSAAGLRTLDQRLNLAAIEVCGEASDMDVPGKNDVRRCRAEVKAQFALERDRRIAAAAIGKPVSVAAR